MRRFGEKLGEVVVKHKILIVILSLLLLIPSVFGYIYTNINYDILVYLPEDIETMKGQQILADDFSMGSFAMCSVENMSNKDLLKLEDQFKTIDGVNKVISAVDVVGTTIPLEILPDDMISQFKSGDSELLLVTFDDSTIAIDAITQMREMVDDQVKIGGMSASTLDTSIVADSEILSYVIVAVALVLLVLLVALDSYLVPFILLGTIGIAILYNMGSNIMFGEISYITKAIAAVLQLGVTTDFSIFLYHKYEQAKKGTKDINHAMSNAIGETFISVAGSALTTVAGFLALVTMQLTLGKDIGLVMAKGVVLGVIATVTIFPSFLLVFDKAIEKTKHKPLLPTFRFVKGIIKKGYKIIVVIALLVAYPAFYGNQHIKQYYNLTKDLPSDLQSCIANTDLKDKFNIVSAEVVLINKNIKNDIVNEMIDKIKDVDGVDIVLSPSELSSLAIPEEMMSDELTSMFESDQYEMIFINSTYEVASDELNNQISTINDIVKSYDANAILAGEGPCMKDLVQIAAEDFNHVSIASIGVIFVIMIFVLKSASLPFVLVSTIELAIFINMACGYYTNATIPFVASIVIGTIQLGATIDYAILLTTKYVDCRKAGHSKFESMEIAVDSSISSIFVSALSFFGATIGVGVISKLNMIASLCTLMSRGAIISMLIVVFLLPSLLLVCDKVIVKTTVGMKKLGGANNE